MKRAISLTFFIITQFIFSQKEADTWYFGRNAGLSFTTGSPVALTNGILSTEAGCATISDTNGDLLFYTDGVGVYNRSHQFMPNASASASEFLNGCTNSTQAALIVPKPGVSDIYYIFTLACNAESEGLQYSVVDMNLEGGLGDVSIKNIPLRTPMTEKLTAVKSTSFNGYWVITHDWGNDQFASYKVSSSGIDVNPIISNSGDIINGSTLNAKGQMKVSPKGDKLALATEGDINKLQLFDFDSSTGIVSNPRTIVDETMDNSVYGTEFSPSGDILYMSGYNNGVYQYDLTVGALPDIKASEFKLTTNVYTYSSMQLANDGRIYVVRNGMFSMDYITDPEIMNDHLNYQFTGVDLAGKRGTRGLPPFIQSFFAVGFSFENVCTNNSTLFTTNITETYNSILWDFGDPSSGVNNTSIDENPTHVFSNSGVYSVTLTVTSGSETSIETKEVRIYETPTITQPANMLICDADNNGFHNFNLTTQNVAILNGQNTGDFRVDYYESIADFNTDTPISDYTSYQNNTAYQSQTIIASVKNKSNTDCVVTSIFNIQVFESPRPALNTAIPNLTDCDNTSVGTDIDGFIQFNLTDRETAILNGQLSSDFEITYFLDAGYTMQIPTADITAYENTSATQTIYTRVTNRNNTACSADTSFILEVFELPIVAAVVSLKQCDNDIDGRSFFNLTEVNEEIITNATMFTITYHETQALAESGSSAITNFTTYENQTVSTDTVWARIENSNGCYRTSQINLVVSTTQIPLTYTRVFYECDDGMNISDGIATFDFSQVTNEIVAIFPPSQQLIIKYYQSEADALAEMNAIPDAAISNYQNTASPNQQNIYIRVDSALDNDCLGLGHHITLNVEAQPVANAVTVAAQCDNDRDGLFGFDTSNIESTLLGTQTGVTVTYFDASGIPLSSPLPNPFNTASQTIRASVTNGSSLDPDGQCFAETTIAFVVNTVPIANPISPQEQCDDDTDGIVVFDTTTIENTILGTQTGMVVTYFDENGAALPSPLPNPFNTASQTITVRIENPVFAICFEETTVEFIVRDKPTVNVDNEAVICMTNAPAEDISVNNPNINYTYTWSDANGMQVGTGTTITVNQGGVYSVIATSPFGCDSLTDEINVIESEVATFTMNSIEITDDSTNNTVEVDTSNLGIGDYEFSLLDVDLDIVYGFQDSPVFDNLEGGIYTIQIRDKNGCGIEALEVSVISYPSFITPNNDGHNDTWTIKGFNTTFYPTSSIYIFNRFGKVMATLSPDNPTWNGFFNDKPAPSNDYWFSVELIDGNGNIRTRKGNFSLLRK